MALATGSLPPLSRTISPFKDPRPSPNIPINTGRLCDEYERRAVEIAKQRKKSKRFKTWQLQRSLNGYNRKSTESTRTPSSNTSSIDQQFSGSNVKLPSTTVAICKMCKRPIAYPSGVCDRCKKTIIAPVPNAEDMLLPPRPSSEYPITVDPRSLDTKSSEMAIPKAASPKRRSFCPIPLQLVDPTLRFSTLQPPVIPAATSEDSRDRKHSLTDPNEPFLRIQIVQQNANYQSSRYGSHPTTPTTMVPLTPPSTSQSRSSTRPSSLATVAPLPPSLSRKNSGTPNDFYSLYPYASTSTTPTSPLNLSQSSYALQNTTSAWDDWDSEGEEEEKVGLVGWRMGRRKGKKEKGSSSGSSNNSMDNNNSSGRESGETNVKSDIHHPHSLHQQQRKSKEKKSNPNTPGWKEDDRLEQARFEAAENAKTNRTSPPHALGQSKRERRPSGFVRVITCGCRME